MRNFHFTALLLVALAGRGMAAELTMDAARQAVAGIDALRQPQGSLEIGATISTLQNGREIDSDRYAIQSDGGGNALLLMLNVDKRGQKILNTGAGVWMYFPKTRRPIRLTALQQLHGSASVGDILQVRWNQAYTVGAVGPATDINGQACQLIRLDAASDSSAYARIDLYVDAVRHEPVKADLYTFGGKLLKSAWYDAPALVGGRRIIARTRIATALDGKGGKETVYTVVSMKAIKVGSEQFTLHALEVGR